MVCGPPEMSSEFGDALYGLERLKAENIMIL
jgi:hypothetical protein